MSDRQNAVVSQRADLAEDLTSDLEDGRHYTGLGYREIEGERRLVEVVWNHEIDNGGVGYPQDDFSDRGDSERHRDLAVEKVGEPSTRHRQTTLLSDGGTPNAGVDQQVADAYLAAKETADTEAVHDYLLKRFAGDVLGIDAAPDRDAFEAFDKLDIGFEAPVDIDTLGGGFEAVLADRGVQDETGSFYTPDYVVNYIVEETVGPQVDDHDNLDDVHVLDPACGAGDFLLGALEFIAAERQSRNDTTDFEARRRTAANNLYGVDIQPEAVEMSKLRLRLAVLEAAPRPDLEATEVARVY